MVVTFDRPGEPLNILSLAGFQELDQVLTEVAALDNPQPLGVMFISNKPDNFIVGADIREFQDFQSTSEVAAACRQGQELFGRIGALPFPTVAAINGPCLGGGLELALNCTSRIVTDHTRTALGLPEVKLGLLPGLSGSLRLPRLVGVSAALEMLLTGRNVYPRQALRLGLVDEVVGVDVLRAAAGSRLLALAERRALAPRKRLFSQRLLDGPLKSLVYRQAVRRTRALTWDNYPAPAEIIKVVRQGLRRRLDRGLEREAQAFGHLIMTPEHKALRHLFFAGRAGRGDPDVEPRPVTQVGIVGAGLMGAGIATVCLDKGLTVRQKDVDLPALAGARGHIQAWFDSRVSRRIRTRREADLTLTRYSGATDYSGFGRAQMVVEAVYEDLDVKRQVIADLEARVSHETVIATNTSSLSIADIAEGAAHPERIVGLHFFSPVEKMPLLEIVPSRHTDPRSLATATALGRLLGKTVIVARDSPGFYVNRILTPYLNETFQLLEDGIAIDTLDRYAQRMGFPVGPCTLLDEVGLDVASKVSENMLPLVGERLELGDHNRRFAADNRLGRKNGRGFYTYVRGRRDKVDASVYELLDNPRRRRLVYDDVRQRLLVGLLNECAQALDEGIIASPSVADVGAVYGFGFPPFLGGPFWAMDQIGLPQFVAQLRELQARHGPRFAPVPSLVRRAEAGERYCAGS